LGVSILPCAPRAVAVPVGGRRTRTGDTRSGAAGHRAFPGRSGSKIFLWCHTSPRRIIPGVLSVRSGEAPMRSRNARSLSIAALTTAAFVLGLGTSTAQAAEPVPPPDAPAAISVPGTPAAVLSGAQTAAGPAQLPLPPLPEPPLPEPSLPALPEPPVPVPSLPTPPPLPEPPLPAVPSLPPVPEPPATEPGAQGPLPQLPVPVPTPALPGTGALPLGGAAPAELPAAG